MMEPIKKTEKWKPQEKEREEKYRHIREILEKAATLHKENLDKGLVLVESLDPASPYALRTKILDVIVKNGGVYYVIENGDEDPIYAIDRVTLLDVGEK